MLTSLLSRLGCWLLAARLRHRLGPLLSFGSILAGRRRPVSRWLSAVIRRGSPASSAARRPQRPAWLLLQPGDLPQPAGGSCCRLDTASIPPPGPFPSGSGPFPTPATSPCQPTCHAPAPDRSPATARRLSPRPERDRVLRAGRGCRVPDQTLSTSPSGMRRGPVTRTLPSTTTPAPKVTSPSTSSRRQRRSEGAPAGNRCSKSGRSL
jgi:hypothetical protein